MIEEATRVPAPRLACQCRWLLAGAFLALPFASLSVPGCRQAPVACLRPGAGAEPPIQAAQMRARGAGRPAGLLRFPSRPAVPVPLEPAFRPSSFKF
jgi:hypothetical protein